MGSLRSINTTMPCLCRKLVGKQYSRITEIEARTLKRVWEEAPQLFQNPSRPNPHNVLLQTRARAVESITAPQKRRHTRISSNNIQTPILSVATATVSKLEKTYSDRHATSISTTPLNIQWKGSIYLKLFCAIEQSDHLQRICYYAFAQLHKKGTSVNRIVKEIEDAMPRADARAKVYRFLHIGTRWMEIVDHFGSIVASQQQLAGLLCLLESGSTWERASPDIYRLALANLHRNTDIYEKSLALTPFVTKTLSQIALEHSFIDETRTLALRSNFVGAMPASTPRLLSTRGALHTLSPAEPAWKAASLAAAHEAMHESSLTCSDEASLLLILLSFLSTSEKVPLELLFRGATPRKRWNEHGNIDEVNAMDAGLIPELASLCSDTLRLGNAFHELHVASAVSKNSAQDYTVCTAVAARLREKLSPDYTSFWRCQALVVAYRTIPWKYVEPTISNTKEFFPHLQHALEEFQGDLFYLPATTRADLVLTLIEASRFPNLPWKRFVVSQAEKATHGLEDWHLQACIAQAQCLISRITSDIARAESSLDLLDTSRLSTTTDKRIHLAGEQIAIQRSLNCIQVEELSAAKTWLENLGCRDPRPSPMKTMILFRREMLLGRVFRFQGEFSQSLVHLERARQKVEEQQDLIFDEDLRDLTCDLADTLRELDQPAIGERHLRTEIARQDQEHASTRKSSLLELSLAEMLFGQGRFNEAEELCLDVQSRPTLLRFEKLRLHITLAKIYHINSDYERASAQWAQAMVAVSKFPNESGATRIIVMSVCDILARQKAPGQDNPLLDQSLTTLDSLGKLAKPDGVRCWIAGLRHWVESLQSRDASIRRLS